MHLVVYGEYQKIKHTRLFVYLSPRTTAIQVCELITYMVCITHMFCAVTAQYGIRCMVAMASYIHIAIYA